MVEAHPYLFNDRCIFADFFLGLEDVFAILPASAVATEHAGKEGQGPLASVVTHLPQRIGQQRIPIAIAPIDRQLDSAGLEFTCGSRRAVVDSVR